MGRPGRGPVRVAERQGGARRLVEPLGGRAAGAAGGYRNAQCVQLRSARLAEPRHHMSRGAGSCHSAPVGAPKLQLRAPPPTLTMSICCCFFFRDYGSSKRKSGKRISAHIFLTFQLHALVPLILRRTFAGGGSWGGGECLSGLRHYRPACPGVRVHIYFPLPVPCPLSSLPRTPSFSSLVPLTPGWK